MRIVFMGTPEFSVGPLNALYHAGHSIVGVYSQPPRPAGRGQKLTPSAVAQCAQELAIDVYTPVSLKPIDVQEQLAALNPDLIVVVAYGLLLPKAVLDICPCVNIHASLLPRWRGAAPIQRAILAGDETSGVAIMQMDEGLDTGDIILEESLAIAQQNAGQLHDSLSDLGSKLIVEAVDQYPDWNLTKQVGEACYANKLEKSEACIDWSSNGAVILSQVRAFNPWPGAFTSYEGAKLKILAAEFIPGNAAVVGEVVDSDFSIACADGVIKPTLIQKQGKKAMPIAEFLKGNVPDVGAICS
jgi:methionyl-tRNA formyltransferase